MLNRIFLLYIIPLIIIGCLSTGIILLLFTENLSYFILPTLWFSILIFVFAIVLKSKAGDNLFAEIGFLYLGLGFVYTAIPAITFIIGSLNENDQLALLLPAPNELGKHLWRHVLFFFSFAVGYLFFRGNIVIPDASLNWIDSKRDLIISSLIVLITFCICCLLFFSGPVNSYYDHYTRYDHLPWVLRKLVSTAVRLNQGFYTILIFFLFLNFKRYKILIPIVLILICFHEISYSFGSRIQSLIVLLVAFFLYNFYVKKITIQKGIIIGFSLATLFSILELAREMGLDFKNLKKSVSSDGLKSASEFGSVFFPGFHLYAERGRGTLPQIEWQMFFSDFISIFTFGDFDKWNPMSWYAKNYYPDSEIAPFTLGPIADSAIWGGEFDLFIRGILNGILFAFLVRWFIKYKSKWWVVCIYTYCYATCILTLKYSIFYHLTPLVKTILPSIIIVGIMKNMIFKKVNNNQFFYNFWEY